MIIQYYCISDTYSIELNITINNTQPFYSIFWLHCKHLIFYLDITYFIELCCKNIFCIEISFIVFYLFFFKY